MPITASKLKVALEDTMRQPDSMPQFSLPTFRKRLGRYIKPNGGHFDY